MFNRRGSERCTEAWLQHRIKTGEDHVSCFYILFISKTVVGVKEWGVMVHHMVSRMVTFPVEALYTKAREVGGKDTIMSLLHHPLNAFNFTNWWKGRTQPETVDSPRAHARTHARIQTPSMRSSCLTYCVSTTVGLWWLQHGADKLQWPKGILCHFGEWAGAPWLRDPLIIWRDARGDSSAHRSLPFFKISLTQPASSLSSSSPSAPRFILTTYASWVEDNVLCWRQSPPEPAALQ